MTVARRRLLLGDRRRFEPEGEEGNVLRLVGGGDPARSLGAERDADRFIALLRRHRRAATSRARNILARRARPTSASGRRWRPRARRCTRRARAAPPPLRDEKILAAWNGLMISAFAVGGRVLDEPRYVDAAARAADFVLDADAPGRAARRAAPRTGAPARPGSSTTTRFVVRRADRPLRGQRSTRAGCARRWRSPTRPSGCSPIRRGGWFMTAADHEKLIAREKPRLRRRRAVGDVGRAAERPAPARRSRPTIAGARSPSAPSPRSRDDAGRESAGA